MKAFLKEEFSLSDHAIARLKFIPNGILLNKIPARVTDIVPRDAELSVRIDDGPSAVNTAPPMDVPLDILWEDEYLAVLRKPANQTVHGPNRPDLPPTIANAAAFHWGGGQAFHPISRLDRGTSGLLLLAKCSLAHDCLRRAMGTESFRKGYMAVCDGHPEPAKGSISLPIGRSGNSLRRVTDNGGRPAATDYQTLYTSDTRALLALELRTGRTHQIRAHLSALGCPITGDAMYGTSSADIQRPALHAAALRFAHPFTGRFVSVFAPPPEDFLSLLPCRDALPTDADEFFQWFER